jgi:hypothetical protein
VYPIVRVAFYDGWVTRSGKNTKRIRNKVCLYVVLVRRATRSLYVHVRKFTSAYNRFVSCSDKKNEYEYSDIREKTRISEYETNTNPIPTHASIG